MTSKLTPPATLAGGSLFYPDKAEAYTLLHDGVYYREIQLRRRELNF